MERRIIFKDTVTGEELVMPVTPKEYQVEHGRKQNTVTMHTVGDVTSPGPAVLLDEEPEFLLPAKAYPFVQPGAVLNPFVYIEKLERWSDAGTVLRWVVAGTPCNAAVRLGPIRYREQDGTNDIYCTVPIRGVRQLESVEVEIAAAAVPLAARPVEADPTRPQTYTVVAGDTLSGICRKFYGDASLAAALGAANGIKNINLIRVGQVLTIPPKSELSTSTSKPTTSGKVVPKAKLSATVAVTVSSFGPSIYLGSAKVGYVQESGAGGMMLLSTASQIVTVKAKRGSTLTITKSPGGKGRIAYIAADGKNHPAGAGSLSVKADGDKKVGVYWAP